MSYKSESIATSVRRINQRYFLPAIQREFVWEPDKVVALFDSIMRNYPISSFLFWEVSRETSAQLEIYKFIDQARRGTHNSLANTGHVQDLILVLDGQQRLTSLLIGLSGFYSIKKKYGRWDDDKAYSEQQLFLNLLEDPTPEKREEGDLYYGFAFYEAAPEASPTQYWFPVSQILGCDTDDKFSDLSNLLEESLDPNTTKANMAVFRKNLNRLYLAVWKEEFISYYLEPGQDYDRVLDIFVRANEGGTPLSKSDLLLSIATLKWTKNAREEIHGFVDNLNNKLSRKNNFNKDFVMKACLVLADLPVRYRVSNFTEANLQKIEELWPKIQQAVKAAVNLTNTFGIDRDTLTSTNALLPIAYYCRKTEKTLATSSHFDVSNSKLIRKWLISALLKNVFSGSSDTILTLVREELEQIAPSDDFPIEGLNKRLIEKGRAPTFDEAAISKYLDTAYGERHCFTALSLLYEERPWGNLDIDHIFPQDTFKQEALDKAGIPEEKRETYKNLAQRIGNLELLTPEENLEKLNKDFGDWITSRDGQFNIQHLIPSDNSLFTLQRFEDFINERETLIKDQLAKLLLRGDEGLEKSA